MYISMTKPNFMNLSRAFYVFRLGILVKIDYCGHDLKPVILQHKNNYKNVSYEYKDTLGFSCGYF